MADERRDGNAELDELEEQADSAADFVEELLSRMDIDAIAEPNEHAGHMYVDILDGTDDDMSLLIGKSRPDVGSHPGAHADGGRAQSSISA